MTMKPGASVTLIIDTQQRYLVLSLATIHGIDVKTILKGT